MKKILALLLVLAMMFCMLAGCGGSDKEDTGSSKKGAAETVTVEPGKYLAVSCVIDGEEYPCDQDWLEIEAGGSGVLVFEGEEYSMDWTLSGSTFSFEDQDGSTFEGTYADGVIEGVLDGNMEYTFELEGGAAPAKKGAAETVTVEPGKYLAIYCAIDDEEYDCDQDWLEIEADGVGILVFEGTEYDMEWEFNDGLFTFEDEDGSTFVGSYAEGTIAGILDDNIQYVFEKESTGGKKPAAEEPAESEEGGFEPVSATIGGYDVTVVGAELFKDTDDKDGIRVYWDFTNTSDETTYAYSDLSVLLEQEGFELTSTYVYSEDDVPEYGNETLDVRPGVSIRCISEYNCKADGEPITFTIYDWYDEDDALTVEFDPMDLPGRPAKDLEIEPVSDPAWTEDMDVEGYVGEDAYVVIESAEVVPGWDSGEEVIRVYFTFTNEYDEAASFWWANNYRAFQDGVELNEDWADEDVEEDDNASLDIQPGESIYCSVCWELRSDSPVEIEVYDWDESELGIVFDLADLR